MVQEFVKLDIFLTRITILNLSLLYKDIFVRIARKLSPLPLILSVITLIYLIILKYTIALELKENLSLTSIAKRYNISITSVQRIMDSCYSDFKVNKEHLPELFVLMNLNLLKNIDGAMSFVFANYQSKSIIDIVEDRRLYSLTEYFSRFSLEARNNVKYVCMDMYVPYISLVNSIFPNAEIVIDKFHIVNLVSRAFNQTRIYIMNSIQDPSLKRKLKRFWKLLLKYYPDLCEIKILLSKF